MIFEEIEKIYDRLEGISVKIEPKSIPNPRYISEKIGQCHVCIEEVEKFYIKISREMSVLQRALNNAEASYAMAKDDLLSSDPEITSLPSARDREARANTRLKSQTSEIKEYKSQLSDLEKLFDAINVKLKNLNRLNMDIKVQLRLMESQIKLGVTGPDDSATRNLMEELKNTALGKDMWEEVETKSEENATVDPTKSIEAQDLDPLELLSNTVDSMLSEKEINSVSTPEINSVSTPEITQTQPGTVVDLDLSLTEAGVGEISVLPVEPPVESIKHVDEVEQPEDYFNEYVSEFEKNFPDDDLLESIEPSKEAVPDTPKMGIDLDKILVPSIGGEQKPIESKLPESNQKETLQEKQKDPNEIDFSTLLSQFN
jgi:hypothetical protein